MQAFVILKRGFCGDGSQFTAINSELFNEQPKAAQSLRNARRATAEAKALHTYAIMTVTLPDDWEFA